MAQSARTCAASPPGGRRTGGFQPRMVPTPSAGLAGMIRRCPTSARTPPLLLAVALVAAAAAPVVERTRERRAMSARTAVLAPVMIDPLIATTVPAPAAALL